MGKLGRYIYLDHAATTPVNPQVLEAMMPFLLSKYGNPSSLYSVARDSRKAIESARELIARILGASQPTEIIFNSGGSESDNHAIKGIALANRNKGNHIITTQIEHHAVLHACEYLEKHLGFSVTYLPVDEYGVISLDELKNAITDKTVIVSVMMANNEIGTMQPIKEIGQILNGKGIFFHTDAVQAVGAMPINVQELGVDALSLSGHKFYGPKGVGILYLRKGVSCHSLIHGGSQEKNRRAGTENAAGIVGIARALEIAYEDVEVKNEHLKRLRDKLIKGVLKKVKNSRLTGHPQKRLPNNASFCFEFVEGESILLNLDILSIAASSGSACTSASLEASHVLKAIGIPPVISHGSLRITVGHENSEEEIDYVLEVLPGIIEKLRQMSPILAEKE